MTTFQRGQRLDLGKLAGDANAPLELIVSAKGTQGEAWRALLLNLGSDDHAIPGDEIVSPERARATSDLAVWTRETGGPDHFTIELGRAPAERRFALVTYAPESVAFQHGEARVAECRVELRRGTNVLGALTLGQSDFTQEAAIVLLEIYQKGTWRVGVATGGFIGGGRVLLSHYRVREPVIRDVLAGRVISAPMVVPPLPTGGPPPTGGFPLPLNWPGGAEPRLPSGLLQSIGLIVTNSGPNETATGTGFIIGPGGLMITCAHVVEDASAIAFMTHGTTELRPVEVLDQHRELDIALCHITDRAGSDTWLRLADSSDEVELGLEVGLIGYPLGFSLAGSSSVDPTLSQGIVNSVRKEKNKLQIDAGAAPGSSGSPVYRRRDGRVIGVLASLIEHRGAMHINFASDLRAAHALGWFRKR